MSDLVWAIKNGDLDKVKEEVETKVSRLEHIGSVLLLQSLFLSFRVVTWIRRWTVVLRVILRLTTASSRSCPTWCPAAPTSTPRTSTAFLSFWRPYGKDTQNASNFWSKRYDTGSDEPGSQNTRSLFLSEGFMHGRSRHFHFLAHEFLYVDTCDCPIFSRCPLSSFFLSF